MYKIILATRYLLKRRITYFAVLAIALSVFIVIVVMTVMAGLVNEFKEKNHRFAGDCIVGTESLVGFAYYENFTTILEQQDYIEVVSPVIKSFALLRPIVSKQDDVKPTASPPSPGGGAEFGTLFLNPITDVIKQFRRKRAGANPGSICFDDADDLINGFRPDTGSAAGIPGHRV